MKRSSLIAIAVCFTGPLTSCLLMIWLLILSWRQPTGTVLVAFNYCGERTFETFLIPIWSIGGLILGIFLLIKESRK